METLLLATAEVETGAAYRSPPCNIEAEQAVLGALLINNEHLNIVAEFLRPEHFYEPVHQRIFGAVQKFSDRGLIANPVTLKSFFDQDQALLDIGGANYLVKLASAASIIINLRDYGHTIYDLALKRKLIDIGEAMVNDAYDANIDANASHQIEGAEQQLFALASEGTQERSFEPLAKSVIQAIHRAEVAYKNPGGVSGVTTGLVDMDKLLGGFQESDLIILAGRPSMGKTALATNLAFNAAQAIRARNADNPLADKDEGCVAFFSLEMSSEQLAGRILASVTGINSSSMRRGELNDDQFAAMVRASQDLSRMPFYIDDTPAISISALRTRARRLKRQHNLSMLVVDYLQLMRSTSEQAKTNRVLEISEITQGLKAIAKELNIPVIALSQLSRAVEQRDDKRPQLADLRESGSIEQDADVVIFVYREEYYLSRKMPREGTPDYDKWQQEMEQVFGVAEVIVSKQRHGPIGTVKLHFDGNTTTFQNLAKDDYNPGDFD